MTNSGITKGADISEAQLAKLKSMRILFGHQSVGKNIMDGLQSLGSENPPYSLNIVETDFPEKVAGPVFAHFRVGANMTPDSKIESFKEHVAKSGNAVDLASFKFCYVDVGPDTDGELLFQKYQKMMTEIRKQFPALQIMHVTIPLKAIDGGMKGIVKKIMGKSTGEEANVNRTRYNDLLRKEYQGKEPFFDLAALESTAPDGSRVEGMKKGSRYEALYPQYSDDGEHLNAAGAKKSAVGLLQAVADAAERMP